MNLHTCFFLYLHYYISSIKNRKSGSVVCSFKVKCGFYDKSFFIMSLYTHYILLLIQVLKLIFKVFIYILKKDIMRSSRVYKKAQVL